MTSLNILNNQSDATLIFKEAYENRYSWPPEFNGYNGSVIYQHSDKLVQGFFRINKDLKHVVIGINDNEIQQSIESQLMELSIHRIRRTFEKTHGQNTFSIGEENSFGIEILVGGKSKGDSYYVKDKIITRVNRNIHDSLIKIKTDSVLDTNQGYLSETYSSEFFDPTTKTPKAPKSYFKDSFVQLDHSKVWVLSKRTIRREGFGKSPKIFLSFEFLDLKDL